MRKLATKSLIYYSLFAILMLGLATPLFFWITQKLYLDDVDEAILLRQKEFLTDGTYTKLEDKDLQKWNAFSRDIKILPDTVNVEKGKIIQQVFYDKFADEFEPYRVLYREITVDGHRANLMIRINLVESEDLIQSILFIDGSIVVILLLGFVLLTKLISDRLWKPFNQTLEYIAKFNLEKGGQPDFPTTNTLEFDRLNNSLNKLIGQNLKAFEREKEFTQNASHELQTPLAVIQSKLDLFLQNKDLTEEQAHILQHMYDAISRLYRINKNLLLLAQLEHDQFSQNEKLQLVSIIQDVLPYFREQAEEKKLTIDIHFDYDITIQTNKGMFEIMLNNLFLNAIRHNVKFGRITISLTKDQLVVANSGKTEALEAEKLFKRFSRSTERAESSGLGLAISKKIADLNGFIISYSYLKNEHNFTIRF
ncbi:HAMP domain-containing sensor histidine kinase [Aequorivita sp. CIP111184]|uniref:sensor histidine kinase n=1 Tax=Aequorivita sp. CIP111184 TaxID=2211356 RepID=UPI000DBC23B2|nr:HAMP domain-containing sensor histidine kinase [Aequorivita sp. CIP111184]SRX53866.1 Sensor protein QseC [Aequorivita sp. CIP111184]